MSINSNNQMSKQISRRFSFTAEMDEKELNASTSCITPKSGRLGRRHSLVLRELTVNKLQFQEGLLYGRKAEAAKLKRAFERCQHDMPAASSVTSRRSSSSREWHLTRNRRRELVLLVGAAGTGKSALALSLRKMVLRSSGFYLTGKFDLQQRDEPYSGIAAACRELCQDLLRYKDGNEINNTSYNSTTGTYDNKEKWTFSFDEFKDHLISQLGPEAALLTSMVPDFMELLHNEGDGDSNDMEATAKANGGLGEAKHRFNFCFRIFMRVLCRFGTVVLTLDDLQWADLASLDLIESLILDNENKHLMLVGSYRSDEVDDTHPVSKTIRDIEEQLGNHSFGITTITIGNLEIHHVNQMLVDLVSTSEHQTLELAECVHKKTLGNVFYIIQYLLSLVDKNLLNYSVGLNKWQWNVTDINANTAATDNLVDLMTEKLDCLPPGIRNIIPMISCLGSKFHYPIFKLVVEHFNDGRNHILSKDAKRESSLYCPEEFLEVCINTGLLVDCGHSVFKWEHDKIQEAASSLVTEDELRNIQVEVGEALVTGLAPDKVEDIIFVVASLLNKARSTYKRDNASRKQVATLNLRAGRKAMKSSAFEVATKFLTKGLELLPLDHWHTEYDLSLELFSTGAEAQYCVGNFEVMTNLCKTVIVQDQSPFLDKRRVYNKLIHSIGAQGQYLEARDLCLKVLAKLGCRFPSYGKKAYTIFGMMRLATSVEKMTGRIRKLPMMKDETRIWVMSLLDNLVTYAYHANKALLPLAIMKGHEYTVRYGLSEYAPSIFSLVGLLFAGSVGNFAAGKAYADLALSLAENYHSVQARNAFVAYSFVLPWQLPAETCKKPLLQGYNIGMRTGDTESACWCICFYLETTFHIAGSLAAIVTDCEAYSRQMREVKQSKMLLVIQIWWQLTANLMGISSGGHIIDGAFFDQRELVQYVNETGDLHLMFVFDRMRIHSAFWFGEYETVVDIMYEKGVDKGGMEKATPGIFGLCPLYAQCALSCISMARTSKNWKKYKKTTQFFAKKMKQWVKKGNPNAIHSYSLIQAELAAMSGNLVLASNHYKNAIRLAGRRGFISDQAMAHERFGEHMLTLDDTNDAIYHITRAIQLYEEWGAEGKVAQVKEQHEEFLEHAPVDEVF